MYDTAAKYGVRNLENLLGTLGDFKTRNYTYMLELFGQLVKDNLIDLRTVMNSLMYIVVADWRTMQPKLRNLNS